MPFMLQHVCHAGQEPQPYSISQATQDGDPFTRVLCQNPMCREELIVVGHETFSTAQSMGAGLPPGFLIAQPRRAT